MNDKLLISKLRAAHPRHDTTGFNVFDFVLVQREMEYSPVLLVVETLRVSTEEDCSCDDCRQFCEEATSVFQAVNTGTSPLPELPAEYWDAFHDRLRTKLVREGVAGWSWRPALAVAAALAIAATWGILQLSHAVAGQSETPADRIEFVDDHIEGLDPHVMDFMRQSELFLRSFTEIKPAYVQDIDDARQRATRDLGGLARQKEAGGDFAPVRIVLDEYESVLRDIKNLDSSEDLADIQLRIERNGLVASLKAYQPRVVLVSTQ